MIGGLSESDAKILKWVGIAFVGFTCLDAIGSAWGDTRPVGAFFEEFVARFVNFGLPLVACGLSIWAGILCARRMDRTWVGWLVGLSLFFVFGVLGAMIFSEIPGVGWRIDRLQQQQGTDY